MPGTIVFIPALNEEANLPAVFAELQAELSGVDMLVVDDGSTDGTAAVARAEGAEVLSFGENRGLREGIAAGYRYAQEHAYDFGARDRSSHRVAMLAAARGRTRRPGRARRDG